MYSHNTHNTVHVAFTDSRTSSPLVTCFSNMAPITSMTMIIIMNKRSNYAVMSLRFLGSRRQDTSRRSRRKKRKRRILSTRKNVSAKNRHGHTFWRRRKMWPWIVEIIMELFIRFDYRRLWALHTFEKYTETRRGIYITPHGINAPSKEKAPLHRREIGP